MEHVTYARAVLPFSVAVGPVHFGGAVALMAVTTQVAAGGVMTTARGAYPFFLTRWESPAEVNEREAQAALVIDPSACKLTAHGRYRVGDRWIEVQPVEVLSW